MITVKMDKNAQQTNITAEMINVGMFKTWG